MALITRNRNVLPTLASDFFDTGRFMSPGIFDFDVDLFDNTGSPVVVPEMNIIENTNDYTVELAAPGLDKKDFKVEVANGMLTISAEKEKEEKENGKNYRRREFSYNSFCRSLELPDNVTSDKVDARYENGILKLTLPKKEMTISKPAKQIQVA